MANIQLVCDVLTNSINDLVDAMESVSGMDNSESWKEWKAMQDMRSGLLSQGAHIKPEGEA